MWTWLKARDRAQTGSQMARPDDGSRIPGPRGEVAEQIDRQAVVAEAKILVRQLDQYLELIGEWAVEPDGPEESDEHG